MYNSSSSCTIVNIISVIFDVISITIYVYQNYIKTQKKIFKQFEYSYFLWYINK